MKRVFTLLMALVMGVSLCACGSGSSGEAEAPAAEAPVEETATADPQQGEQKETGEKETEEKKTYVLRAANTNAEESYFGQATKYLFDLIAEKSNGQIVPEYYFSGALGDKTACMEAMRAHTLQAAEVAATDLAVYSPGWSVFSLPFLFDGVPETELACYEDEQFFEYLDSSLESSGLKLLLFYTTGYRNPLNTKHEVRTPADANGIRIRVLQNAYLAKSFELMGFAPVTLGWSEVYSAMQQGTVDGAEQSAALLLDNQLADYGKYLTLIDAIGICGTLVMDLDFYNSLPPELQAAVDEACKEAMAWEWADFASYEEEATQGLIEKGVSITTLTDEEKQAFIDCISGVKDDMFTETPETETFYNEIKKTIERVQ